MEAQAFVEPTSSGCSTRRVAHSARFCSSAGSSPICASGTQSEPDWRKTRERDRRALRLRQATAATATSCPTTPLIILGLLYGDDDFQKSLMIANTCGWDTDCNSGNVGCLMGIKNGLAGHRRRTRLARPGRRPAVPADAPTAARAITDAVTETTRW